MTSPRTATHPFVQTMENYGISKSNERGEKREGKRERGKERGEKREGGCSWNNNLESFQEQDWR